MKIYDILFFTSLLSLFLGGLIFFMLLFRVFHLLNKYFLFELKPLLFKLTKVSCLLMIPFWIVLSSNYFIQDFNFTSIKGDVELFESSLQIKLMGSNIRFKAYNDKLYNILKINFIPSNTSIELLLDGNAIKDTNYSNTTFYGFTYSYCKYDVVYDLIIHNILTGIMFLIIITPNIFLIYFNNKYFKINEAGIFL